MLRNENPANEYETEFIVASWKQYLHDRGGGFSRCYDGGLFCQLDDNRDAILNVDEVSGTGTLVSEDGDDVLEFEFTRNNLSEENLNELIGERVIELTDFEFDAGLVKGMYERAGKTYDGTPINIEAGYYDVNVVENGNIGNGELSALVITIKIRIRIIKTPQPSNYRSGDSSHSGRMINASSHL